MPIIYSSAEFSRRHRLPSPADSDIIDADDSIVLSDLVRTGEQSRLRRRGAMRLDHGMYSHSQPTARGAAPADEMDEGTTGSSSDRAHMRFPLRRYSSVGPADDYRYRLYCYGCQLQDTADPQPSWVEGSCTTYEPSPLPLYPTPPHSAAPGSHTTKGALSCGALIHAQAAPRHRLRVWTAKCEASDVVVPMDPEYFDSAASAKIVHSPCGCVREGVGCALCGNPLGTRYKPCRSAATGLFSSSSRHPAPKPHSAAAPSAPTCPSGSDYHSPAPIPQTSSADENDMFVYTFFSSSVTSYPRFTFPPRPIDEERHTQETSSGSVDADTLDQDQTPTMMFDRFVTSSPRPASFMSTEGDPASPVNEGWNGLPAMIDPDDEDGLGGCY